MSSSSEPSSSKTITKADLEKVVSDVKATSTATRVTKSPFLKFKYSLYSALAFFLLASPQMFTFVNSLVGSFIKIADNNGCPTHMGLVIHTLAFLVLLYIMMSLPRDLN